MAFARVRKGIMVGSSGTEDGYRLNGHLWTKASVEMCWSDGVAYCFERGKVLQSVDDAAGFLYAAKGRDFSYKNQLTRTLMAKEERVGYLQLYVFDFPPDKIRSFAELVRGKFSLNIPLDSDLAQMIMRIAKTRQIPLYKGIVAEYFCSSTIRAGGRSEYETNEVMRMFLPTNARKNAVNIRRYWQRSENAIQIRQYLQALRESGLESDYKIAAGSIAVDQDLRSFNNNMLITPCHFSRGKMGEDLVGYGGGFRRFLRARGR